VEDHFLSFDYPSGPKDPAKIRGLKDLENKKKGIRHSAIKRGQR